MEQLSRKIRRPCVHEKKKQEQIREWFRLKLSTFEWKSSQASINSNYDIMCRRNMSGVVLLHCYYDQTLSDIPNSEYKVNIFHHNMDIKCTY